MTRRPAAPSLARFPGSGPPVQVKQGSVASFPPYESATTRGTAPMKRTRRHSICRTFRVLAESHPSRSSPAPIEGVADDLHSEGGAGHLIQPAVLAEAKPRQGRRLREQG